MDFKKIKIPKNGSPIRFSNNMLHVPDDPIIPFIEGDDAGIDIWKVASGVFDAAVENVYNKKRKIHWMEVYAGDKANLIYGNDTWLPDETIEAIKNFKIAIKGPMSAPPGGDIRSINVALRQVLDLYSCIRPVQYFEGVPTPVKKPEDVNVVIFRENTEDIYSGIEFEAGSDNARDFVEFLKQRGLEKNIRFSQTSSFGVKPVSKEGTERLVRAAIRYAITHNLPSVTIVHKGNIMKYTEGYFAEWAYELAHREFPIETISMEECGGNPPPKKILIKDILTDAFLYKILTKPSDFSVIATMNLNGDYISDALSAQVGGIGLAPGANINYETGHALFEPTHGTAPKYAGLDKVNPSSVILAGAMMFEYIGWTEVSQILKAGIQNAISKKNVTYDLARLMDGAREVKCSEFGKIIIEKFKDNTNIRNK